MIEKGLSVEAQLKYEAAFKLIQSTRCKEIKNYLFFNDRSKSKSYSINIDKQVNFSEDKAYLITVFKKLDQIKIKTVELVYKNKDYYKVIFLTR